MRTHQFSVTLSFVHLHIYIHTYIYIYISFSHQNGNGRCVFFSLKKQYFFCWCAKEKQNSYRTSLLKNFPLIYSVSTFLMEKEKVYMSHIISNCNAFEKECVNKCKFMFHFVEFFSNQDSAGRNDLLRREFEVSVGSAQMLRSEMGQLIGKCWCTVKASMA